MRTFLKYFVFGLFLVAVANATTINVPNDYPTIQTGLDAATANDTILVASGVYYENIIWPSTDGLFLLSKKGVDSTIVDGNNLGSCIQISMPNDPSSSSVNIRFFCNLVAPLRHST